ncbi:hypothetical protein LOH54_11960 [Sulfurimonas sp. HSL-3221]|uniref:hypothetical protein n=1 Tax=Thiomicrolovo sulfuroxydans TaxID=2894755 RepID=UPI001E284E12|nr:hypothetical protein [Sulfurimonas sp. HSL-3221]UFS62354.1 hypothetical protein LOH54_11960 [Sulfurimonas sp. HSL-3221]
MRQLIVIFMISISFFCLSVQAKNELNSSLKSSSEINFTKSNQPNTLKLLKNDKERIKREEIFREEVRKEIEKSRKPTTWYARILKFFNTPLGIWLLSTVVVGVLGWLISRWQSRLTEERKNKAKMEEIDLQIALRLKHLHISLKKPSPWSEYKHYSIQVKAFLTGIPYTALSPDLKDRTTISLLFELGKTIRSIDEKNKIQNSIDASMALYNIMTEGWGDNTEKSMEENRKKELVGAYKKHIASLQLDRWSFSVNK